MDIFHKIFLVILTFTNFPKAFADKLHFIKGETVYTTRVGISFIARAGTEDMAEIAVVVSGNEYDLSKINFSKNPLIVDVGAHIGTFCLYISKKVKKSIIFSYEPDVQNYSYLVRNISMNRVSRIKPINSAISDYSGTGYLKTESLNTDAYFLTESKSGVSKCNVVTLYKEASKRKFGVIDILKMDIEGGEYALFQDPKTMDYIAKNVRYIFVEHHDLGKNRNSKDIKKAVKSTFEIISHHKNVFLLKNLNV